MDCSECLNEIGCYDDVLCEDCLNTLHSKIYNLETALREANARYLKVKDIEEGQILMFPLLTKVTSDE